MKLKNQAVALVLAVEYGCIMFVLLVQCMHGQGDAGLVTTPGEHVVLRPNSKLTPGAVRTTSKQNICETRTPSLRHVPASIRRQVFAEYKIDCTKNQCGKEYEVDHLISLEIGGTNDLANLWPQPYETGTTIPGARQKDVLENKLHAMICDGSITPQQAQKKITTDWYKAYKLYVGSKDGRLPR